MSEDVSSTGRTAREQKAGDDDESGRRRAERERADERVVGAERAGEAAVREDG
jgi:hypothetical protein